MPSSEQSLALAEQFRRAELRVRAEFWRNMLALWPLLDSDDLSGTQGDWARLTVVLVQRYRDMSAALAQQYVQRARLLDVGKPGPVVHISDMPTEQITKTLVAVGPHEIENSGRRGMTPAQARHNALAHTLAATSQLVLDGGRDVVERTISADDAALGWMRITDGDPCSFCAMTASRGAVYASRREAGGTDERSEGDDPLSFKSTWHNGCGCAVVPVFTTDPVLPQTSVEADRLWRIATKGVSGNDKRLAFRRAMEGRPKPGDPILKWANG
jgi:hypothetical protein